MRRNSSLISQGRFSFLSVRNLLTLIYSVAGAAQGIISTRHRSGREEALGSNCFFFLLLFLNIFIFFLSFFFHSYENILSNTAMKTEWIIPKCLSQILCYKADAFLFPQCNDFMGYSSKSLKIFVLSFLVQTPAVWQRTCWPLTSCGILQYRKKNTRLLFCLYIMLDSSKRDSVFKN